MVRRRSNRRGGRRGRRGGLRPNSAGIMEFTLQVASVTASEPFLVTGGMLGLSQERAYRVLRARFEFGQVTADTLAQLSLTDPKNTSGSDYQIAIGQARFATTTQNVATVTNSNSNTYYTYGGSENVVAIWYGNLTANPPGILRVWVDVSNQLI